MGQVQGKIDSPLIYDLVYDTVIRRVLRKGAHVSTHGESTRSWIWIDDTHLLCISLGQARAVVTEIRVSQDRHDTQHGQMHYNPVARRERGSHQMGHRPPK